MFPECVSAGAAHQYLHTVQLNLIHEASGTFGSSRKMSLLVEFIFSQRNRLLEFMLTFHAWPVNLHKHSKAVEPPRINCRFTLEMKKNENWLTVLTLPSVFSSVFPQFLLLTNSHWRVIHDCNRTTFSITLSSINRDYSGNYVIITSTVSTVTFSKHFES